MLSHLSCDNTSSSTQVSKSVYFEVRLSAVVIEEPPLQKYLLYDCADTFVHCLALLSDLRCPSYNAHSY